MRSTRSALAKTWPNQTRQSVVHNNIPNHCDFVDEGIYRIRDVQPPAAVVLSEESAEEWIETAPAEHLVVDLTSSIVVSLDWNADDQDHVVFELGAI